MEEYVEAHWTRILFERVHIMRNVHTSNARGPTSWTTRRRAHRPRFRPMSTQFLAGWCAGILPLPQTLRASSNHLSPLEFSSVRALADHVWQMPEGVNRHSAYSTVIS
jgi:hypothetical protein